MTAARSNRILKHCQVRRRADDVANKRYWFIKLSETFFLSKTTRFMIKTIGYEAVVLYLRLILRAIANDGEEEHKISFNGLTNDLLEEIAFDLDTNVDVARQTLDFLERQGLVEIMPDACIVEVPPEMIGSITGSGLRMRKRRETLKASQNDGDVSQSDDSKNKKKSKNQNQSEIKTPPPRGQYANVFLDDADVEILEADFPHEVNGKIEKLSEYLHQHPQKEYADHAAVLRKWLMEDAVPKRLGTEQNRLKNHEERDYGNMSDLERELTKLSMNRLWGKGGEKKNGG